MPLIRTSLSKMHFGRGDWATVCFAAGPKICQFFEATIAVLHTRTMNETCCHLARGILQFDRRCQKFGGGCYHRNMTNVPDKTAASRLRTLDWGLILSFRLVLL